MARTASAMIPLGTPIIDFELPDPVSGGKKSLWKLLSDKATLIVFMCNHCPFVKNINEELLRLSKDYQTKGASMIAINSNDVENFPEDSPEEMKKMAESLGYTFPYLFDEDQKVARAYKAACTPDFFLFDGRGKLVYRGQLDDSRPGNEVPVTGKDLRKALDTLLKGQKVFQEQKPSIGCNIKWKS
ncbi:thioredoxin family protein [Bacteroidetes bacterium endosymbiont of Geopemphigus sp.]|uniref:thioredoxin family protein n=1 Tax=Bacteroidetes bacterium endosymbiont of Geopemphigus sp. TaxID=2047937 RepID=UPI000CD20BC6|nr:thioredoxin family protein [Bacteroidetes bacterium endosymbiont of Geopemphigus sp.]